MIRRFFSLIFIIVVLFFLSHLEYRGKPVRQYFQDFYNHPKIQESVRQAKAILKAYLEKDVGNDNGNDKSLESHLTEQDRQELEKILKQELKKYKNK